MFFIYDNEAEIWERGKQRGTRSDHNIDLSVLRAIELQPTNTDYRLNRANIRLLTNRKKEAREDLDAMVRLGVPRANLNEWYKKCR